MVKASTCKEQRLSKDRGYKTRIRPRKRGSWPAVSKTRLEERGNKLTWTRSSWSGCELQRKHIQEGIGEAGKLDKLTAVVTLSRRTSYMKVGRRGERNGVKYCVSV